MNIENSKGTLQNLLLKVQEQNNRSADFLASTNNLQKMTNDEGKPQIVIEAAGGEPTRILDVNDHAFGQIAQNVEIDTRTAPAHLYLISLKRLITSICLMQACRN